MTIFDTCPECGDLAIVQPELGSENYRIFRCKNDHKFRKPLKDKENADNEDSDQLWEAMPDWARKLHELEEKSKERSFQG
jgi:hypothetical protein